MTRLRPRLQIKTAFANEPRGQGSLTKRTIAMIATRFGTPVHVFSPQALVHNIRSFASALADRYPRYLLTYSVKTNYLPSVLRTCARFNVHPEVIAGYEMDLIERLGLVTPNVVLNGPMKTVQELERAIRWNCYINADSREELENLNRLARRAGTALKIGIRLNLKQDNELYGRFGFSVGDGEAFHIATLIKEKLTRLRLVGLHCHVGTNIADAEIYREASIKMALTARQLGERKLLDLEYLDFGGGFASRSHSLSYTGEKWTVPTFEEYANALVFGIENELQRIRPLLIVEPGRSLVDSAFVLLTSVRALRGLRMNDAILDVGVNSLPSLLYRKHSFLKVTGARGRATPFRLLGPTCLGFDIVAKEINCPSLRVGDIILITDTGAYSISQEYPFSRFPPPVVQIETGNIHLIRSQTSIDRFFETQDSGTTLAPRPSGKNVPALR
jgi:diaminopimelate decarboxylase